LIAELDKCNLNAAGVVSTDSVRTYLKSISKHPLLSAEQEVELSKRIEAGLFAEKILEVAAALKAGTIPREFKHQLLVEAFHGLDIHGMRGVLIDEDKDLDDHPDRVREANQQVNALIEGIRCHMDIGPRGRLTLPAVRAKELALCVADGKSAKNIMINSNLRLVVHWTKFKSGDHLQLLDFIQEGNLGLIHAVEKFDHTKGFWRYYLKYSMTMKLN
jgi:RNA polymerase primary sigma factor